jgi:type VI secretion system protein ImpH
MSPPASTVLTQVYTPGFELSLNRLTREIREYSLFQGIQLVLDHLQRAHPDVDEEVLYERLELHANPSLGFPGSDIDRVRFFEEHGELRARVRINLVSLFGAGSPLPAFYGEQALGDSEDGNPTRDFLDLFNNRLQRLLLPIWQKYRYYGRFKSGASDPLSEHLFALIGLGGESIRQAEELNWKRLLPYLGLLSLRAHSAALIESVLRYYFKHADLHIEQCLERKVEILAEQRNRLGLGNSQLSEDLVLGEFVRDRGGKFRIHARQLCWERFHEFLPVGNGYQPLCALVRFTLRDPLDYDIRLELRHDEIRELRLGAENPCLLGWTTWLGTEHADGVVTLGSAKGNRESRVAA